ncbi:ABC transporter permease [Fredinandcohnia sp. QZ13]|uniref:ABC transporter permease n=1 Tax=Fredinandcohnia sp. QZ13 TaxID=3073144 RepID=UPI0028530952|nr:ABC transporter permease [Fredinandcohnia sp. QZ13]MDR4887198.1 ABC transporter permease [Fredinandcohnia sp. QZ13]
MIDIKELWSKRQTQHFKEISRYLRYMLNDHLLIALLFLGGGGAYYYNYWLQGVPKDFPYAIIIALLLGFILTNSRIQTLVKEPDLVFLLPIEKKLTPYFQKAFWYSLFSQIYLLLIVFAVAAPLYLAVTDKTFSSLAGIFVIVLLCKAWNLLMTWFTQYYTESSTYYTDIVIRLILNIVLMYFLFSGASILVIAGVAVIMIGLILYFHKSVENKAVKWNTLIELESKRMLSFYRIANLFTDVPKLKERVKKRPWLNWVTGFISYSKKNTFRYLYTRTFLRTSDYLGIYVRLTIIGGLIIYFVPFQYGKAFAMILFLYLTGYQLITLWRHHSLKIWVRLYPVSEAAKFASYLQLLFQLLVVQSILFTILLFLTAEITTAFTFLVVGLLFVYLFVFVYTKGKVRKLDRMYG